MKKILLIILATVLVLASSTPALAYNVDQLNKALRGEKDCAGLDLSKTDIRHRNFSGYDFSGANLTKALMKNIRLYSANLAGATMPDGTKHP